MKTILVYKGVIRHGDRIFHCYERETDQFKCVFPIDRPLHNFLMINSRFEVLKNQVKMLPRIIEANFKSCFEKQNVFVIQTKQGQYLVFDPISEQHYKVDDLSLLNIWDIHYPNMESHFIDGPVTNNTVIKYLTKSDIKKLTV